MKKYPLGFILGTFTTFAALMGAVMNFAYMFSGTTSTNPQMILIEIFILVAGFNTAKIGLDCWIIPVLKRQIASNIQNPLSKIQLNKTSNVRSLFRLTNNHFVC